MNILLLGSGGREHAIAASLVKSPLCDELFVAPGNGGTAGIATNVKLNACDEAAVLEFVENHQIGLVVIGPEAPLVAGIADAVRNKAHVPCFGPGYEGARLEGSKQFAKQFMDAHGIPTAGWQAFTQSDEAHNYVDQKFNPACGEGVRVLVVKADGLAAGKGVIVAQSCEEAHDAVDQCFNGAFGDAGKIVVIEDALTGPECSLLAFVDGATMRPMATAQDHKRALEGDKGLNTGGMGVYSPVPIVTEDEYAAMLSAMQRACDGLVQEGISYKGVLYGGFMLTPEGPKVLEFNARFGDPETQVILPRLKTDLAEVMLAVANGRLSEIELEWRDEWAVSVVLASKGYPQHYDTGFEITGIEEAQKLPGVVVYHAGTKLDDAQILRTAGGRVINVTALGNTFEEARERAYAGCDVIQFEGKTLRRDIGERALRGRSAWEA
ncbi:MAG: phosphoribosylamine--glycine ligase [Coriobacteriales bacterium]|nr:phosphoribosylamine--glycine ligase [Coriobacteriales bacterium]